MTRRTLSNLTLTLAAAVAISMTAVTVAPALTSAGSRNGNPEDFSTNIDNPLFPLSSFETKIFEGEETDPDTGIISTRLESTVLEKTRKVAGIRVLVLEEKAYQDDELIERALDYFAQHENGNVYYFGEKVNNYVDGRLDNHDGSWLAGKEGAVQGIMMPAAPGYIGTMNVACIAGLALLRVGKDLAVPFSWFYWASQWAPVTLVGLFYLQREGLSLRSLGQAQDEAS